MKINNTQNSPNFNDKYTVIHRMKPNAADAISRVSAVHSAIVGACETKGIPCHSPYNSLAVNTKKRVVEQPFIIGQPHIDEFLRNPDVEILDFVAEGRTLDATEVATAINEGRFDFVTGEILGT